MTKKSSISKLSQKTKFIEAARAAGADESEATFDAKLGMIAKAKPKDEPVKKPKK